ncbi:hypothetical protein PIB30_074834 [Stylosanthes scabra]|uniref:CUT domain-containing protein n=1 Tax=Stylosanthes scabra TaxID=79078 RepID=A0ABU6VPZ9_9FABA|nr:hypothetical protein [Stylosanthes scabra]
MAEVEAMGFGNLQYISEWIVNQEIYTYLALKFDLDNNVIKDDVANIEINAEIVERALGLPSSGDEFPEYCPTDSDYEALKKSAAEFFMNDFDGYNSEGMPSFSLGMTQEFQSPTYTPKRSMPEEILDIPPINEIIPANIQEDLLTANEKKKIYNWVMNASKDSGVQEEMIVTFQGYRNLFLLRMEFRRLNPRKWINSFIINWKIKEMNNSNLPRFTKEFYCVESRILDTILNERNLITYETKENTLE